jgi:hypothetical protein
LNAVNRTETSKRYFDSLFSGIGALSVAEALGKIRLAEASLPATPGNSRYRWRPILSAINRRLR